MFEDVEIYEIDLDDQGTMAVLRGGFGNPNPKAYMDAVVSDYVNSHIYNEFVEEHLDTPWVRIVISGINGLHYKKYVEKRGIKP